MDSEKLQAMLNGISEAFKTALKELSDFMEAIEEIQKIVAETPEEEREKYTPCLVLPLPPPTNRGVRLWKTNRAVFRPSKKEKARNNTRQRRAKYELF